MPSFDLVSKIDKSELKNAVEMVKKVVHGRYDFKGSQASIELSEDNIELRGEDEYKMKTLLDLLREQMAKRGIGLNCMVPDKIVSSGKNMLKQNISLKQGIDKEKGKIINKLVKESGLKIQSTLMDEKVRLEGKKIDDLQKMMAILKNHKDVQLDLQMENMKR